MKVNEMMRLIDNLRDALSPIETYHAVVLNDKEGAAFYAGYKTALEDLQRMLYDVDYRARMQQRFAMAAQWMEKELYREFERRALETTTKE